MLTERSIDQVNNKIKDAIQLFAVRGRYKLIGSNSLRSIQYGVDYDVEDHLLNNPAFSLQHAYHIAKDDPDCFVIELKCGVDDRLVYEGDYSKDSLITYLDEHRDLIPPQAREDILAASDNEEKQVELVRDLFILRWTDEDVFEGKIRLIDGSYKTLQACCLDKSTMKIDLIVKVGNQFAEISENYYIQDGKKKNYETNKLDRGAIIKSLEDDIYYYSKKDSFKALKRLFSLYQFHAKENKEKLGKLVGFFNGQVGLLNKIKSELTILNTLLTNSFREVAWDDIYANLQFIKEQISQVYQINLQQDIFQEIDGANRSNLVQMIDSLRKYFAGKINSESKEFLKQFI